ncbi:unnamed protein product [Nippostrongylus brasiliensis]|uniref:Uncharacterized protein n=1 Tax=Nippostrongylus brasiliensis TaxID=27835 RepID=A0A0N4XX78_NIPBR|nr:unnamed protein product [Nippostrongylus brasiliensis]
MLACHAGGPGSIPGRCNVLSISRDPWNFSFLLSLETWIICEKNQL